MGLQAPGEGQDPLSALPLAALRRIFEYLRPRDLCLVERICTSWRDLPSKEEKNRLWWRHVMRETWDEGCAPTAMGRAEKKKLWKDEYAANIAPKLRQPFVKRQAALLISRKAKVNAEQDQDEDDSLPEAEWGSPPKDKVTMRTYYKSIRSKPKNKRAKGGMRTHTVEDYTWDNSDVCAAPRW